MLMFEEFREFRRNSRNSKFYVNFIEKGCNSDITTGQVGYDDV